MQIIEYKQVMYAINNPNLLGLNYLEGIIIIKIKTNIYPTNPYYSRVIHPKRINNGYNKLINHESLCKLIIFYSSNRSQIMTKEEL